MFCIINLLKHPITNHCKCTDRFLLFQRVFDAMHFTRRFPGLLIEKPTHSITDPPPYLTVGKAQSQSNLTEVQRFSLKSQQSLANFTSVMVGQKGFFLALLPNVDIA
ncbi:hypothetical protein ILYODFUR_012571 [Ilyodon furcidens]|uniref:Uncharacterized protein n=1 Tax=Ilyodon furcidens TaxID=33524 RepID=A0ABV0SWH0_9TELE